MTSPLEQVSWVLKRLRELQQGAVENKQKADEKENERLRNEVKLSAEGMRIATQAVNAVQSSFQALETNLLEKVNAAFEEAPVATQAVKHIQDSLQSMEQMADKQLAERLEKSEAGRKKLRQAISILQEKLEAMEKVLKVNEMLRKECEKERQRADNEKQKAEEEKRLKSLLEKDSTTFKDQMAKILQRLGAVENKQKADKKENERLRNEVKLSAEGMRVATQAVNAVQSSFQALETNLLEKVNAAFEEARVATQAVKHMQDSLQSMEQMADKQGSSLINEPGLPPVGRAPEKLVDEISRLFSKERQSHCKIEHRLSMLKSAFKVGRRHHSLTSAENAVDLESLASLKNEKDKVPEKRKSRGEDNIFDRRVSKRMELFDAPAVNSAINRLAFSGHAQAHKDQSLSSPVIEHQRTSDEPGALPVEPRSHNTASSDYLEEAVVDHRGSSNGNVYVQVPPRGAIVSTHKENLRDPMVQIVSGVDCKTATMQKKCSIDLRSANDHGVSHAVRKNKASAEQEEEPERGLVASRDPVNVSIDVDLKDVNEPDPDVDTSDDSDEWWWSNERVLLSPSLPEILSPVPFRESSPRGECFDSFTDSSISGKELVNDSSVVCEAANLQGDAIDHGPDSPDACNNRLGGTSSNVYNPLASFSGIEKQPGSNHRVSSKTELVLNTPSDLGAKVLVQKVPSTQDDGLRVPEICNNLEAHDVDKTSHNIHPSSDPLTTGTHCVASHETCTRSDPVSKTTFGHESSVVLDNSQFEGYMLEAVGVAPLAEIDEFLEVLPPLPDILPSEFCAFDSHVSVPRELVDSTYSINKVCALSQPQAACEKQSIDKGCRKESGEKSPTSTDLDHVIHPISQGWPSQVELSDVECTRDKEASSVMEPSSGFTAQDRLPLNTKPSNSSEASTVFLLQAFEIDGADAKVDLTAACIIVNKLETHLLHTNAEKEGVELQELNLYKASTGLPLVYMACCIISSAVNLVRSEKGGAELSATANTIKSLLQAYVAFIRSMFGDKASIMLNTILAQLGRFLIQGEAMLVTLKGTVSPCEDPLGVARVFHDKNQCKYEYFEATLGDIYAGGKVLAALCQVLACVTHLQNIVYEVLGWCDKDIIWLLTVFSSFSSICGHTAFMVEADDLLGHAICAIIVELVASVEQDSEKKAKPKVSEATPCSPDVDPNHLVSWDSLKEVLKFNGTFSVKQVFLAALGALHYLLGSTGDSLLSSLVKTDLLTAKDCVVNDNNQRENHECVNISYKRHMEDSCMHPEVSTLCKTVPESLLENQTGSALKTLGPRKWQRKYMEAVTSLELIAQFMGWDWTYNHLILKCLWKMGASGSTQICAAGVSHVLSILTRLATKDGGMDVRGLADLNLLISHFLRSTSTFLAKAESILLFDPH
ncbi:hypothetical protein GOP47_0012311 [Adiantum capillus-veneris]|uniref:Uncharacterized protein n=1 Tax=Adiantum capillus-veneris TaxID=13818 RepID=A0A9D4ZGD3_ADICA|nr:hypothetical protein GOP47_0012311 [Adiantum capillus-veneris]